MPNAYYLAQADELGEQSKESTRKLKNSLKDFLIFATLTGAIYGPVYHFGKNISSHNHPDKAAIYYGILIGTLAAIASLYLAKESIQELGTNVFLRARRQYAQIKSEFYI